MHRAGLVAAQDHQLLAHARDVEVAGLGDQAFVPDEQPGAGEQFLQLLAIRLGRDEDLAADGAALRVDHPVDCFHRTYSAATGMARRSRPISVSQSSPFRYEA